MQALEIYPVGKDPDVLAFGPGLKRLYASSESGKRYGPLREWTGLDLGRLAFHAPRAHGVRPSGYPFGVFSVAGY